jgi:tetratricopeptide (TPR) repeat protein
VQQYVADAVDGFEPSDAHLLLPTFAWHGLATTNYDRLVESAYERKGQRGVQRVRPLVRNGDRIDAALKDVRSVGLLKLHGCVTRLDDRDCPLILTPNQYIDHRKGRSRIFDQLRDWAYGHPLVFIGHSLQDPDIRAVLLEITTELAEARPRYYAVAPSFDDIEIRTWEGRRVTPITGTFSSFMRALDREVPASTRAIAAVYDRPKSGIALHLRSGVGLSDHCMQFLRADAEFVGDVTATRAVEPRDFYRGLDCGWSGIEQGLDVRRALGDTMLADRFLVEEAEHPAGLEFVLVKAHAGAGKSVLLRRVAWEACHEFDCVCLYLRPHGSIDHVAIQELVNAIDKRVFFFVDDVCDRTRELINLSKRIGPEAAKLTIIGAERLNEWNVSGDALSPLVTDTYELRYLSHDEIDRLLDLLERHRALGTLEDRGPEERQDAFAERAGRQLLVALHEATLGKSFEDIIQDEYDNVTPADARRVYLSICVLNRLHVRVRAGIISRLHGIRFVDFRDRFFGPLEHIVFADYDGVTRDYVYQARHPHIADIVFHRVLDAPAERLDAYVNCLVQLNVDYDDDRRAYRQMVRGRSLIELFPSREHADKVYAAALRHVGEDAYLLHQMALYEMHCTAGDLNVAGQCLSRAASLAPGDATIQHSVAELKLRLATTARSALHRDRLLADAAVQSRRLVASDRGNPYAYVTLIKAVLAGLQEQIGTHGYDLEQPDVRDAVRCVEDQIQDALQRFPGDSFVLELDAKFAGMISDSERALTSLDRAFRAMPQSTHLALRLSGCYRKLGDDRKAEQTISASLEANPSDGRLHYALAKLMLSTNPARGHEIAHHLKRAFSMGDENYDAQLLYGRQLYTNGDLDGARGVFRALASARVPAEVRDRRLYPLPDTFQGTVAKLESAYSFIRRDGSGDWVYAWRYDAPDGMWAQLRLDARVRFKVAFNFRGPCAQELVVLY